MRLCTKVNGGLFMTAVKSGRLPYDEPIVFEIEGSAMRSSCARSHLELCLLCTIYDRHIIMNEMI